jgi:hypothetical protein
MRVLVETRGSQGFRRRGLILKSDFEERPRRNPKSERRAKVAAASKVVKLCKLVMVGAAGGLQLA